MFEYKSLLLKYFWPVSVCMFEKLSEYFENIDTVHNGYSDNGGDMGFLAKLSLYPLYHYIQYITLSNVYH